MQPDKFTSAVSSLIADAQNLATDNSNNYVEPVHILLALSRQEKDVFGALLVQSGGDLQALKSALEKQLTQLPQIGHIDGNVKLSKDSVQLINLAEKYSRDHKDSFYQQNGLYGLQQRVS